MKKRFILLLAVIFLFGCSANDSPAKTPSASDAGTESEVSASQAATEATTITAPSESAETGQTESTAQTEPEEQADAYPFGNVEDLEYLSYDEYFGQIRNYEYEEKARRRLTWKWNDTWYSFSDVGKYLAVYNPFNKTVHQLVVPPEYESCEWVFADGYWAYGIRNGEELFRVDYFGEHYQTLFYDGIHILQDDLLCDPYRVWVFDYCVAFFAVYTGDSATICRLYLPTMTLDTIYTSDCPDLRIGAPMSNVEFFWWESNPELVEMIEQERNDPNSEYYGLSVGELKYMLSHANHIPSGYSHYFNAATGEHYMVGEDENGWPYYGRTPENIEKNGGRWWKDFQ